MSTASAPRRVKIQGDLFHGRVPDGAVYVGRAAPGLPASRFKNPFPATTYGLAESRRLYREFLRRHHVYVDEVRRGLEGRDLACWCSPDAEWCHADDLLKIAAGQDLEDL